MATYAIGDIQGCYDEFIALLELVKFDPHQDTLWIAGDLVNRGPQSLSVLRFIKQLDDRNIVVLGNHDFHLLAIAEGHQQIRPHDTFQDILNAPDRDELLFWLRHQKLCHIDTEKNYVMAHAGILPQWSLNQAQSLAQEVEAILQSEDYKNLLAHMYGNEPDLWDKALTGWDRYRFIINVFVRMRYCDQFGRLNFSEKGSLDSQPSNLLPWFQLPNAETFPYKIIFGHWAALNGITNTPRFFAIDTGCSWGHALTAFRLEDEKRFQTQCIKKNF